MTMNSRKTSLTLEITAVLTLGVAVILALPLSATTAMGGSGGMIMSSSPPPSSYLLQQHGGIPAQSGAIEPGVYARGTIASLQNGKDGKPAWIVSGLWKGSLTNMSSSAMSNLLKNLPTATFNAIFNMVTLNGSASHEHQISNFTLTGISIPNEKIMYIMELPQ